MPRAVGKWRRYLLHGVRWGIFATILLLIRAEYLESARHSPKSAPLSVQSLTQLFEGVAAIDPPSADGSQVLLDAAGEPIGLALQTSPQCDHIIGFSGPTNLLIAMDSDGEIVGIEILSSGDTRDHVREVVSHPTFLESLNGVSREQASQMTAVDAVSGATLTSLAIRESIIHRLGGGGQQGSGRSLKFPAALTVTDVQPIFPRASHIELAENSSVLYRVLDDGRKVIGEAVRTSPIADNIVGYQGPSDALIGLDGSGQVVGIALRESYDNQPYTTYAAEDRYFAQSFNGLTLKQLSELNLQEAEVEGVSGATMTSMAVAEGIVASAESYLRQQASTNGVSPKRLFSYHDWGTLIVIVAGLVIGMTSLRANKYLRVGFQLLLVVYLGLAAGNLISQAMLVGWAQHGLPWRSAPGLVLLTVAALSLPLFSRRNLYCTHLCPHGAAQQLLKGKGGWKLAIPAWLRSLLKLVPALLLLWCVVVGMTALGFSLVDIEAFDAYLYPVAGWSAIAIAVVGLIAALFLPMAYCRYGCPTGLLLEYLRFNARSDCWTVRDWVATGYLLLAIALWL